MQLTEKQLERALETCERVIPRGLFNLFRRAGMDRDDVLQEARLAAWKWLDRDDLRFSDDERLRLLPSRVIWDLRDILRLRTGRRRSESTRESFEAIVVKARQASAVVANVRAASANGYVTPDAFAWNASLKRYDREEARKAALERIDDALAVIYRDEDERAKIIAVLLDFGRIQEKKRRTSDEDLVLTIVEVLAALNDGGQNDL